MDLRSTSLLVAASAALTSGCLRFDDASGQEGYCFDDELGRYRSCLDASADAGLEPDADFDSGATPVDVGFVDSGVHPDATPVDTGIADSGVHSDAMPVDAGFPDSGVHPDAMPVDMGVLDSGVHPDAMPVDMGVPDSGVHPDAAPVDVGFPDSGVHPDAMPVDAGFPDSGVHRDAAPVDAGFPDSGVPPDGGFPFEATVTFTGPGRGQVFTDLFSVGSGFLHSWTCDYDGSAATLTCYEFANGVVVDTIVFSAAPFSLSWGFDDVSRRLDISARGRNGGVFSGFTGDCLQPPPVTNGCRLAYPPPPTRGQSATARFD